MSYDDYLRVNKLEDCKDSWVDWRVDVFNVPYIDAVIEANDPDRGYEC